MCSNAACGLVWPDPMPLTEDIGKAYVSYYTHAGRRTAAKGFLRKTLRQIEQGYWTLKYGYPATRPFFAKLLGLLLYLFPLRRSNADQDVRLLSAVAEGRVLDVGCGSGDWLIGMQQLGWKTEGVDFDEKAVKAAQDRNLDVRCGTLEDQHYASESFDAVTLNHVIEHVPDPVGTLKECVRILRPGGKLVVFTPNAASASHRFFGKNWRGLEPPRHLHIFTPGALRDVFAQAGLGKVSLYPVVARSVIAESLLIERDLAHSTKRSQAGRYIWVLTRILLFFELCLVGCMPSKSDCVGVTGVKP